MKKFLIGLGVFTLVIIILMIVGGGFVFIQSNKYAPSIETFVNKFYKAYNAQESALIYNSLSDDKLRKAGNFEEFDKFIKGTYQKLGAAKSRKKGAWRIFTGVDGTFFNVQYKVTREKGESVDSFTLKKENESWILLGYHVNSKNLY